MKLWLLKWVDESKQWYDEYHGHVIRAETEQRAREIAAENGGDESRGDGAGFWLDPARSTCVELTVDGEQGVILSDFNAG